MVWVREMADKLTGEAQILLGESAVAGEAVADEWRRAFERWLTPRTTRPKNS